MVFGDGDYSCALLVVKPGRMIYEMDEVAENIAGKAISVAAPKIPIRNTIHYFEIRIQN